MFYCRNCSPFGIIKTSFTFSLLETGQNESDEEDPTSMVTRPLTWRTEEVTNFFHILDQRYKSSMTNQQKRQSVKRRVGRPSHRNSREIPEKNCSGPPPKCNFNFSIQSLNSLPWTISYKVAIFLPNHADDVGLPPPFSYSV